MTASKVPPLWICLLGALSAALGLCGCQLVGGMVENYRRDATHAVQPEYTGMQDKSFAVLVTADRSLHSEYPELVPFLTDRMTQRLASPGNKPKPAGFVPPSQVLKYQLSKPAWSAKPLPDLATELGGVQRLILVDLFEFRLRDPGNAYEWAGQAGATVSVVELDGAMPDQFSFERMVQVKFPDQKGHGPDSIAQSLVQSALAGRLIDRTTWLFYEHQEPYYPTY